MRCTKDDRVLIKNQAIIKDGRIIVASFSTMEKAQKQGKMNKICLTIEEFKLEKLYKLLSV